MTEKNFKGVINGKTFTTVEDYNAALKAAVDAKETIDAHTYYNFTETTEPKHKLHKCDCKECKGDCKECKDEKFNAENQRLILQNVLDVLPLVEPVSLEGLFKDMEGDEAGKYIDNLSDAFYENMDTIKRNIAKMQSSTLRLLVEKIQDLEEESAKREKPLQKKIETLQAQLDEIEEELYLDSLVSTAFGISEEFYKDIKNQIVKYLDIEAPKEESTTTKENETKTKEDTFDIDKSIKYIYNELMPELDDKQIQNIMKILTPESKNQIKSLSKILKDLNSIL